MYHKTALLFLAFLLSFSLLHAKEKSDSPLLKEDTNSSLFKEDINISVHHNWNTSIYNWNELGTGEAYPPLISADMNTSIYNWNALSTRWINMRAVTIMAFDISHFHQDERSLEHVGDMSHYDRIDVRGVRLGVVGTINFDKPWTYVGIISFNSLTRDFDSSVTNRYTLYDAIVSIPLWGEYGRMQIGKMKAPISMERIMGMIYEQEMERPAHLDALLDSRSIGIDFTDMIFDEQFTWRVGVFNNWMENYHPSFSNSNQEVVGRVTAVAYEDDEKETLLHLGAAYRYVDIREETTRYKVGPEQWFVDPWADTGNFAADASHTLSLEMSYLDGPLWLASEYTATSVDSPQFGNPTFSGYHVALNYFLTGEQRGYNKRRGLVRRITPRLDFTNGGHGAFEVSTRYSSLDLTDGAIQGGKVDIGTVGIIWHPRRDIQFHLQWSRVHLKRIDEMATSIAPTKSDTDILQFRLVLTLD